MTARRLLPDGSPNPLWYPGISGKSGKSGKRHTSMQKGLFLAWDGEGATIGERHEYILLKNNRESIRDEQGLDTLRCFAFMVEQSQKVDKRTIHLWFGMSYDVNMVLRDVPRHLIALLWQGKSVDFHQYNLSYRHRKQFTIRLWNPQQKWRVKDGTYKRHYLHTVTMWDSYGFFQSSFMDAIETWLSDSTDRAEIEEIKKLKTQRHAFSPSEMERIEHYCGLEVDYLRQLGEVLHRYLIEAGICITRWDGAGAVAAGIYKQHSIKKHMEETPVVEQAKYAYAGGRIELVQYGTYRKDVYTYDLNSAYPAAMVNLPSLRDGRWRRTTTFEPGTFSLWRVHFRAPHSDVDTLLEQGPWLYPLFYRNQHGNVRFPRETKGWYWEPEVAMAHRYYPEHTTIIEGYVLEHDHSTPFHFVHDLYKKRQSWKKQGIKAQLVLKLGINSLYGKMIQQKGGYSTADGKIGMKPPYHQIEWGGYITSATRAKLFGAAMQKPHAVIFLATDGICTTEPLDLDIGDDLGQWSLTMHKGVVCVQSGVYFYLDDQIQSYYRGFDKGALNPDAIRTAWRNYEPTLESTSTRFRTMGSALQSDDQWKLWRTWDESTPRALALSPLGTKRFDSFHSPALWREQNPADHLLRTIPTPFPGGVESFPYKVAWSDGTYNYGEEDQLIESEIEDVSIES